MAKCLVLGANGFLGSHLVDSLVIAGHFVRAFDRYPDDHRSFIASSNVEVFPGDFLNRRDINQALNDIDYVFHFISTTTPVSAEEDPLIDVETNVRMSIELFQECTKKGVKKVIFPSSGGAVYGDTGKKINNESTLPAPISPYAIGKLTIEYYLRYFNRKHGLNSVVYRISNPYGERQSLNSRQGVIPIFIQQIQKNKPITIFGDGSMTRDYIYVKDAVEMISGSFEASSQNLYNIGSGKGESINEIVNIIKRVAPNNVEILYKDNLSTFVQHIVLDISRFENEFSLRPMTSLEEGVKRTWDDIQYRLSI